MIETWVPINGYEGLYEVSDFGRYRSLDRYVNHRYAGSVALKKGRILNGGVSSGYLMAQLWNKNIKTYQQVHRLVAMHFLPNPDNLPEVNHLDFDKLNNHVKNLEWCTHKENINYSSYSGRYSRNGRYTARIYPQRAKKLTAEDADTIRLLSAEGATTVELLEWFPVCKSTINRILAGKMWR